MSAVDELRTMTGEPAPPTTRRLPNPWVAVPVLVATGVGWFIGRSVARISCTTGDCGTEELVWGLTGALVGFVGVLIVSILVVRSFAEWAAISRDPGAQPPEESGDSPTR